MVISKLKKPVLLKATGLYEDDNPKGYSRPHSFYCYLHGKLQDINHYDIFTMPNGTVLTEGIHDVKVKIPGIRGTYTAVFFVWKVRLGGKECWNGLVVAKDDKESMKDAQTKYSKKAKFI